MQTELPQSTSGRSCGSCTLCCKMMEITELAKPVGSWCSHCAPGKGCKIYDDRPSSCRGFECAYLFTSQVAEHWYPAKCKMVVTLEGNRTLVRVDDARPGAWREEPYYSDLKGLARSRGSAHQLLVLTQGRTVAIVPDADIDLGVTTKDHFLVTKEFRTANGLRWEVEAIHVTDPRAAALRR